MKNMRYGRVSRIVLAVAVAVAALLVVGNAFRADGGITVQSYTVSGRGVAVVLHNSGSGAYAGAGALAELAGGQNQWGSSFATYIPAGATVTVNIYYSTTVTGVIEGPDPIGG